MGKLFENVRVDVKRKHFETVGAFGFFQVFFHENIKILVEFFKGVGIQSRDLSNGGNSGIVYKRKCQFLAELLTFFFVHGLELFEPPLENFYQFLFED